MAQSGDTITYSFSDGTSVSEDVSGVDIATVNYCDGAGGGSGGGSGGRVENAEIDVGSVDTLYIWVAESGTDSEGGRGRYDGSSGGLQGFSKGGGSTEISFSNTEAADSADEPFLVGSGGGGGGAAGARGGGSGAEGEAPPLGGGAGGGDGEGAVDDQNRGLVSGGTTITGGGSSPQTNGEIQISYESALSRPDPPSNLSAEVQ